MKAAIFDMDGLLVDSEPLWTRAEKEVFGSLGLSLSDQDCAQTVGLGLEEVVEFRFRQHPWKAPDRRQVAEAIHRRVRELLLGEASPKPGARHALELFSRLGFRLGLATASDQELIEAALGRTKLLGYFQHLQSAVGLPPKPHPEVFLRAARALGAEPANCVGLEDSLPGLQAVRAAGMKSVAVPEPRLRSRPEFSRADLLLCSLEELTEDLVMRLFGER